MNYVDLILIIISVLSVYAGYRMGFLYSLVNLISLVVGIPFSAFLSSKYSGGIYDSFTKQYVIDFISNRIEKSGSTVSFLEELQNSALFSNFVTEDSDFTAFAELGNGGVVNLIEENLAKPITIAIIEVVIFVVVIVAFSVLLSVIKHIVKPKQKNKDKPLTKTNMLLGAFLGVIKALASLVLFSTLAFYVTEYFAADNEIIKTLDQSVIINYINSYNPFIKL